jgi:hypothetical protein
MIEGTSDTAAGFREDVGIDLGGGNLGVAEEFLDGADIVAGFEEMGGEGVAEGMATDGFGDLGELDGGADGALEDLFIEMMAAGFAGTWING